MHDLVQTAAELLEARVKFVQVSPGEAEDLIRHVGHQRFIFVEFMKRKTGELRKMVCRLGVKKHLKGGPPAYDPREHNLIWVWEPGAKGGYKSIPVDTLLKVVIGDTEYAVQKEDKPT